MLLAPPVRNRRYGFNENSLKIGDVVELLREGRPNCFEIRVYCILKDGKNLYTNRYSDGRTSLEKLGRARPY